MGPGSRAVCRPVLPADVGGGGAVYGLMSPYRDAQDVIAPGVCERCGRDVYPYEMREDDWGLTLCPECWEEEYGE